jgi:putative Holliday junction resolvase
MWNLYLGRIALTDNLPPSGHRLLALDYGRRRVGVAGAAPDLPIAFGLTTLVIRDLDDLMAQLEPILAQREADTVVVGFPLSLAGYAGPVAGDVLELARRLEARGLTVCLVDEALSSRRAGDMLRQRKKRGRKEDLDRASAALLLQEYLDGDLPPLTPEEIARVTSNLSPKS